MFKKFIILGGVTLALLAFAVPAMARGCWGSTCFSTTTENYTNVNTTTTAGAYTGGNVQSNSATVDRASHVIALSGSALGSQTISTGNAYAEADSLTIVNTNPCGCRTCSDCLTSRTVNGVTVAGTTGAESDTGLNNQVNDTDVTRANSVVAGSLNLVGSSNIYTGGATSVVSSRTLVNVQPVRWGR